MEHEKHATGQGLVELLPEGVTLNGEGERPR
jgi:hypothetical protein